MSKLKTTARQRRVLLKGQAGAGFMAYRADDDTTCEVQFVIGPDGTLWFSANDQPLTLTVAEVGRRGRVRTVAVQSRFSARAKPSPFRHYARKRAQR